MFETIKQWAVNRCENNAMKSELSWTNGKGEIFNEQVYLKRSRIPLIGDWSRVYPPVNEDSSWNLFNFIFGGKKNLYKLIMLFVIIALVYFWMSGVLGANKEYMNGKKYIIISVPSFEKFCSTAITNGGGQIIQTPTNLSLYVENKPSG